MISPFIMLCGWGSFPLISSFPFPNNHHLAETVQPFKYLNTCLKIESLRQATPADELSRYESSRRGSGMPTHYRGCVDKS